MRVQKCRLVGRSVVKLVGSASPLHVYSCCGCSPLVTATASQHRPLPCLPWHAEALNFAAQLSGVHMLFAGRAHCGPRHAAPQVGAPAGRSGGQGAAVQRLSCGMGCSGREVVMRLCAVAVEQLSDSVYSSRPIVQAKLCRWCCGPMFQSLIHAKLCRWCWPLPSCTGRRCGSPATTAA